jgi:chromosome segregation protein
MPSSRLARLAGVLCVAALPIACAEPPNKELSQAQGAIDAARAAGAAEYAVEDFGAATDLLTRAHQSVGERDYRAALSHALESSARAQAAARAAVEGRVRARVAADQAIGEVASAIAQVRTRLNTPEARRVPATVRRSAQRAVAAAETALAAARAAVAKGDFGVIEALSPHREALAAAAAALTPAPTPARPRDRR